MKKYNIPKRNKLVRSLALTGLLACITASASIDSLPNQPTLKQKSSSVVSKASTVTPVSVNKAGGIYIYREDDTYYFWSINDAGTELTLTEKLTVDLALPQNIAIELMAATSGLFYSDNLVPNADISISFSGNLTAGKIAIPLSKQAFLPLLDTGLAVSQSIIIDSNTPELLNTVNERSNIYAAAEDALIDVQALSAHTNELISTKMIEYKDILQAEAAVADQIIQDAEAVHTTLQSAFETQVQSDADNITQETQLIEAQINSEISKFELQTLPCVSSARGRVEKSLAQFGKQLESIEREFDESPRLEAEIDRMTTMGELSENTLTDCVEHGAGFETLDMSAIVDPLNYEALANQATSLQNQTEADAEQWRSDMEALPEQFMQGLETDYLAEKTLSFANRFNSWISPTFLSKDGFAQQPAALSQSKQDMNLKEMQWLDKMAQRGGNQLCEEETFNISFNIGVVGVVIGTWWDDQIITGNEHNLILALPGNDCVESHDGIDLVLGMRGMDRIFLGDHHDIAHGGWGIDEIHGSAGRTYGFTISGVDFEVFLGNLIFGGADGDFLFGGEIAADQGENGIIEENGFTDIILGDTFLFGAENGDDFIDGEMGLDFLFGQPGNDTLINLGAGAINIAGIDVEFGSYFFGNDGDDTIIGSNTALLLSSIGDFIFGADGIDTFNGNDGRDFIFGSDGGDVGTGGAGNDFIFGSRGEDDITGGNGIDLVFGGDADDEVRGGNGLDLLFGGPGDDLVEGQDGPDMAFGARGMDTINGGNSFDLLFGGPDDDIISGNDGWDLIFAGAGRDNVFGNDGWDMIFGGRGTDRLFGNGGSDVVFGNTNDQDGLELINGGPNLDLLFGNDGREQIFGEAGLDLIFGNAGDDIIFGGDNGDLIFGNAGNDEINGQDGTDLLFGNNGNDIINGDNQLDLALGNDGCDVITGGDGPDLLFGGGDSDRLLGGLASDLLFGNDDIDELLGQQGTDLLFGNAARDLLDGGDQLDLMFAGGGDDFLLGGNGNDLMFGSAGNDFMNGQGNGDFMFGGDNNDVLNGANGNDFIFGRDGNDRLNSGNDTDFTFGGNGADRLRAVEGRNFAFGNRQNDVLDGFWPGGWDARDFLFGNQHNDDLTGNNNSQRDMRIGGSGTDNRVWNTTWVTAAEFNGNWVPPVDPDC